MNRLLAKTLGAINAWIAIALVLGGIFLGTTIAAGNNEGLLMLTGGLAGFLVALLLCGFIAMLVSIRDTLNDIRQLLSEAVSEKRMKPSMTDPSVD